MLCLFYSLYLIIVHIKSTTRRKKMDNHYAPKSDYKKDMGKRLRTYREQAQLTQEKMAEILNVSIKHYSEVERGLIGLSVERLIFLSNFFGISLDYLLKGEDNHEILPFILVNLYQSCPEEKRERLLELLRNFTPLISSNSHTDNSAKQNDTDTHRQ